MGFLDLIRSIYGRDAPENPAYWHKWNTLSLPVRCIDGRWRNGTLWRRRTSTGWEYQNREETYEEWEGRQW